MRAGYYCRNLLFKCPNPSLSVPRSVWRTQAAITISTLKRNLVTTAGRHQMTNLAEDVFDSVDITRENFAKVLPRVEKALKTCQFFSFDCEMTGLFPDGVREEAYDDVQDRYTKVANAAQNFVINQFGLSIFHQDKPGSYMASTFNFYVFPEPLDGAQQNQSKRFLSDAGALSFLASQNFDFNKWIYHGISYMSFVEKERRMRQLRNSNDANRVDVVPTKEEDLAFIKDLIEQIRAWMAGTEPELVLADTNSYRRLLTYQELVKPQFGVDASPGFYFEKYKLPDGSFQVKLVRASAVEIKGFEKREMQKRMDQLNEAVGFSRVLEAIRDSGKPGIGHNCMFDVAYALAAYGEPPLPRDWSDYKSLAARWFKGGIYDTKYIAKLLPELFGDNTMLGDLYKGLTQGGSQREQAQAMVSTLASHLGMPVQLPGISHAPGFEKYVHVEAGSLAHEAGYDAFMTGALFAHLMPLLHLKMLRNEGEIPEAGPSVDADAATPSSSADGDWDAQLYNPWGYVQQHVGRLNLGRTDIPYAALSGHDPPLNRPNLFHVSNLPVGSRNNDVVQRFVAAGLGKPVRVNFTGPSTAFVEVEPESAPLVLQQLGANGGSAAIAATAGQPTAAAAAAAAAPAPGAQRPQEKPAGPSKGALADLAAAAGLAISSNGNNDGNGPAAGGDEQANIRVVTYNEFLKNRKLGGPPQSQEGPAPRGPPRRMADVWRPTKRLRSEEAEQELVESASKFKCSIM